MRCDGVCSAGRSDWRYCCCARNGKGRTLNSTLGEDKARNGIVQETQTTLRQYSSTAVLAVYTAWKEEKRRQWLIYARRTSSKWLKLMNNYASRRHSVVRKLHDYEAWYTERQGLKSTFVGAFCADRNGMSHTYT